MFGIRSDHGNADEGEGRWQAAADRAGGYALRPMHRPPYGATVEGRRRIDAALGLIKLKKLHGQFLGCRK